MKKQFCAALAAVMLLSIGTTALAAALPQAPDAVQVSVNLDGIALGQSAWVQNGETYLPFRAVAEALGYDVTWSGGDGTVTAEGTAGTAVLDLKGGTAEMNGHTVFLSDRYLLSDNQLYLESGLLSDLLDVSAVSDGGSVAVSTIAENNVTITTMKLSSEDENLKVTLQYPQISGLDDTDLQNAINSTLRSAAVAAVGEGLQSAFDVVQIREEYPDYTNKAETYFDYRITYNQNGLLCVVTTDYQYAGGAHGSAVQKTWLLDLDTGKTLQLSDLLTGSYTSVIDAAVREMIDARIASGDLVELTPFETVGENPDFYLSGDGVVIYFQEYEYFPYAAGIQEFTIPYSALEDYLKPGFEFLVSDPVVLSQGGENTVPVGGTARLSLDGNPTTGYTWHCAVADESILAQTSEDYISSSLDGLVGAGGVYVWNFKALRAGETTVTLKYYRDWEGEDSVTAENTAVYQVTVQ